MNKVIVLLCCVGISVFGGDVNNLLKNSSFEHGKESWEATEWTTPRGKVEFTIDSSGHTGRNCAKIKWISGGDNILLQQAVPLTGSKSMVLSFYAKTDVRVSVDSDISCSIITLDKNGQKLQYLNQRFSASSDWKQFTYKFITHEDTARITVYLRNNKTTTWYDDASLIEASSLSTIDNVTIWYPQNQIIADIHVSLKDKNSHAMLKCEIFSEKNLKSVLTSKTLEVGDVKNMEVVFTIPNITGGAYLLKTTLSDKNNKQIEESVFHKFNWPEKKSWDPEYAGKLEILNNFVTELFSAKQLKIVKSRDISFTNPRTGWMYIKSTNTSAPAVFTLDAERKEILSLTQQEMTNETMRFLPKGEHVITINVADEAIINDLVIRTMPEIILCEYQTRPDAGYRNRIWNEMNKLLAVCNVTMEGFVRGDKNDGYNEKISPLELERIKQWRDSGRKTIVQIDIPGLTGSMPVADTYNYWISSIGLQEFDGISIDEFAHEKKENVIFYEDAVKRINENKKFVGKRLYAYSCAAWYTHEKTINLRKTLSDGNHIFAPELYLREQKTETEAKKNIANGFQYFKDWDKAYPGSISGMIVTLCSTDLGDLGYYRQDTHANVDFKVYYDMQMNYMANDPAFFNVAGVTSWIARYTNTETLLWMTELYKHYCIEGKKNLLSEEYGFVYNLPYIKNPDFIFGLNSWELKPVTKTSIKVESLSGWGFARGSCNTIPDGDAFVVMDIDPQEPNVVSQTIKNLVPGKLYSAEMYSADYQDIIAGKRMKKFNSISLKIDGAEVVEDLTYVKQFQSDHSMPLFQRGKRKDGPCLNFHYVVFKALSETAKITIIDRPDKSIANEVTMQKQVLFNFVQVQPYFTLK